jgi:hypothetical protein
MLLVDIISTRASSWASSERHVDGHLVTVEVGVEGRADQRVQLDRLALDQHGLERLNAQTVQRGRTVEHDGVFADHLVQDVPDFLALLLDPLLGLLQGHRQTLGVQTGVDERLEQLQRHLLGQAALVQLEFRTGHDDRTARIVDALAQQVLTEAALLALEHVGQRLQRTLVGTGDDAATAAVVEQGVNGFLQHALFVAHDDVGRAQLDQALQTVVTVDHAAIQIVEIRGREAATVQRHQRAQIWRNDRHHVEDHPLGAVARIDEGFDDLQALDDLLGLQLGLGLASS